MRKFIFIGFLFSLLFLSVSAKGKKEEVVFPMNEAGKIVYTEVVEMPNIIKDILYSRAYEWFAKTFNSAQNVIQMQDKEAGKIIGKGQTGEMVCKDPLGIKGIYGYVKFTISIYVKDGKYKYEITDFVHEGFWHGNLNDSHHGGALENEKADCNKALATYITKAAWGRIKKQTNEEMLLLIESLKKAMAVEAAGDNW